MKSKRVYFLFALALPLQMVLIRILSRYPQVVEKWYSNTFYPVISKGFRYAFGWLPFSFGDIMYIVLIILMIRSSYYLIKNKFKYWKPFLIRTVALASIIYFAFYMLWGLNYYRLPLHQALHIDKDYTTEELVALTEKLILRSNVLHKKLAVDDTSAVLFNYSVKETFELTLGGYESLRSQFTKLNYPPRSIKNSLLRYPLSIMGYSGYLNPITNEAHINGMVPSHRWPVISCHEQAHQLGFAKENEANFIAVMATLNNEDLYFQYSGSIFALRYCLSDVLKRDEELGERLKNQLRPGILANYKNSRDFWLEMDNPLEPIFDLVYANYLKANNQPAGLKSYSYMVALLVNYDKQFPETF